MNEMEKTAITDDKTTLMIDEKIVLSELMSMTCLRAEVSSSESEKVLSGSEKSTCKSCCIRAMGSPILPTTAAKSTWANWLILLKTSGTNSEHNVATTTQITARVASAASQRGTCHPLKCTPARRLTNGRPMTASTAETRM